MQIHELAVCPGCGGAAASPLDLDGHALRSCLACGLVYAPEYGDPEEIYVEGYLTGETDFGLDLFDPTFQEFLGYAAGKRLDVIEGVRPERGALLDVGCGSGELLEVAQQRGRRAVGVEPVAQSAELAAQRGVEVHNALLQDSGVPEGSWDAVTAFHVLEHMSDGAAFLTMLARWARPGGLVVIEVPNWGSYHRELKGREWPGLRPLEHIAHYSPDTLHATFVHAGLEPVLVRTLGFLWDRQTLGEQLDDLARPGWYRVLRRMSRLGERNGADALYPKAPARRALLGVQAAYDRRRKGQVVVGVARVPAA